MKYEPSRSRGQFANCNTEDLKHFDRLGLHAAGELLLLMKGCCEELPKQKLD